MDNPTAELVYAFIREYREKHNLSPSYVEIAEGCFISKSTVEKQLLVLELAGLIQRTPGVARSIQLIETENNEE